MRHAFLCIQSGDVADPEARLQVQLNCEPELQFIFENLRCELLKTLVRLYRGLQTPDYVQVLLGFCAIALQYDLSNSIYMRFLDVPVSHLLGRAAGSGKHP